MAPHIVRLSADELLRRRLAGYTLIQTLREHITNMQDALNDAAGVVMICDAEGWLLDWVGEAAHLAPLARIGITPGCCVQAGTEHVAGAVSIVVLQPSIQPFALMFVESLAVATSKFMMERQSSERNPLMFRGLTQQSGQPVSAVDH